MIRQFDVYGIDFQVESKNSDFLAFLDKSMFYFRGNGGKKLSIKLNADFSNNFLKKKNPVFPEKKQYKFIANSAFRLYVKEDGMIYDPFIGQGIHFKITKKDKNVFIDALVDFSKKEKLKLLFKKEIEYEKFYYVIRYLVHFTLFYFLQKEMGYILLHCACVEHNGNGYIFFGLPGSGKSTIALSLVMNEGFGLVGDNFLLAKDGYISPFPDMIRFGEKEGNCLDGITFSGYTVKGKRSYRINRNIIKDKVKIKKAFLLAFVPEYCIKRMEKDKFADKVMMINNSTKDFYELSFMDFLSYSDNNSNHRNRKCDDVRNILDNIDLFELGIKNGKTDAKVVKELIV